MQFKLACAARTRREQRQAAMKPAPTCWLSHLLATRSYVATLVAVQLLCAAPNTHGADDTAAESHLLQAVSSGSVFLKSVTRFCKPVPYTLDAAMGYTGCKSKNYTNYLCYGQCSTVFSPAHRSPGTELCSQCTPSDKDTLPVTLDCDYGLQTISVDIVKQCSCSPCKPVAKQSESTECSYVLVNGKRQYLKKGCEGKNNRIDEQTKLQGLTDKQRRQLKRRQRMQRLKSMFVKMIEDMEKRFVKVVRSLLPASTSQHAMSVRSGELPTTKLHDAKSDTK